MLITGRANHVLPTVLGDLPAGATTIVMTTWAFGYFSIDERTEFVDLLRTAFRTTADHLDQARTSKSSASRADEPDDPVDDDILGALLIDGGTATRPLAACAARGLARLGRAP